MNRRHITQATADLFFAIPEDRCQKIDQLLRENGGRLLRIRITRAYNKKRINPITIWLNGEYREHALPDGKTVYLEALTTHGMAEAGIKPSRMAKIETDDATWRIILE